MVQVYKIEWVNSSLLPKLVEALDRDSTYLLRISALHSFKNLYYSTPSDYAGEKIADLRGDIVLLLRKEDRRFL